MGTYMELMAVREFVFNLSLGLLEQTKWLQDQSQMSVTEPRTAHISGSSGRQYLKDKLMGP
jgi:hypothetical protein